MPFSSRLGKNWSATTSVLLVSAACSTLILSIGGERIAYRVEQSVPRAITARVGFEIPDNERTQEMRVRAEDQSPNYFALDASLVGEIRARLLSALTLAQAHAGQPQALLTAAGDSRLLLDENAAAALLDFVQQQQPERYERQVDRVLAALQETSLVELDTGAARRTAPTAILRQDETTQRRVASTALLYPTAESIEQAATAAAGAADAAMRPFVAATIRAGLLAEDGVSRPLYRFDSPRTQDAADRAAAAVPVEFVRYTRDDLLTDAGPLNPEELVLLKAEHAEYQARLATTNPAQVRLSVLARAILVLTVVIGAVLYTARQPAVRRISLPRRLITSLTLVALLALTRWAFLRHEAPAEVAVGSHAFATALLALAYTPNVGFAVGGAFSILLTLAVQEGVTFLLMLLAVSGVILLGLRSVRYRGHIVLIGAAAGATAAAFAAIGGVLAGEFAGFIAERALWAAGSALLAAFVIEGVLPAIERAFKLTTGMTLLELCDASKPLMRMLAAEAPGTYNHSLLVGTLAESAAEAIGANGLLARAGGFYHDIGKTNKPEYFVENQPHSSSSRHERLSPTMSLLIILGHVKDGIELAREYRLPASIQAFIAEHHGTTLVEYFYHAANKARRPDDPEIDDTQYRYPGPRPQSKETAIVMICDGVEGAVRAMSDPTPQRIETTVSEIIRKRLVDGQLDESDLTFSELGRVRKSIVKSLSAIYHARVAYPTESSSRTGEDDSVRSA